MAIDSKLKSEIRKFRQAFNTVIIASSNDNEPTASYAPYIEDDSVNFYILISKLAGHTRNILANPAVDLLWIENEIEAKNIFARKRLQMSCLAKNVENSSSTWREIIYDMQKKLGDTIKVLQNLPDFHLIKLDPQRAVYVRSFADAYNLEKDDLN